MRQENPQVPPEPVRPPLDVIVSRRDGPTEPDSAPIENDEVRVYNPPMPPPANPYPDYAYAARLDRLRRDRAAARLNTIGKTIEGIWIVVGILEALMAMRFIFEIAGAHRSAGFIQFLYGVTNPFVLPFDGIFPIGRAGAYIFDPNILVAMVIWALLGVLLTRLLTFAIEPQNRV